MYFLRPQNNESGELDIENIGNNFQEKNEFFLQNNIINERGNQITDMIQEFYPEGIKTIYLSWKITI